MVLNLFIYYRHSWDHLMCSIQKRCPHAFQRSIIEWFHCDNNYHKSKKKKQVKVIDYLILKDEIGLAVLIRKQTSSRDMWYLSLRMLFSLNQTIMPLSTYCSILIIVEMSVFKKSKRLFCLSIEFAPYRNFRGVDRETSRSGRCQ